jgi:aromatic-L-amino-acid decarboxylase
MKTTEFRQQAHQLVDWMADYLEQVGQYPVLPAVKPGDILAQLPALPPAQGEPFADIFADFQRVIVPGMTHWQHPGFHAYFPANSSPPSVLAEMLTATLAAQCMIWQTSPAAAELEERVMEWLGHLCGLPSGWSGVIQDTASTATLCALLTARERATAWQANQAGLNGLGAFTVYCSSETHSSVEKGVKIAGLGRQHLRKIEVDDQFALRPEQLQAAIAADRAAGLRPLAVVATVGTTSSCAVDPLRAIAHLCQAEGLWLHVDGAYGGTATALPELRPLIDGLELADSYVFNPHKWMLTNFDCTAYFVKDKAALLRTFEIMPEYLKTGIDQQVNNYRDWGIQLGRRFRALKLWFVLRSYGAEGIRCIIKGHNQLAQQFAAALLARQHYQILAPVNLNLVCFRYAPAHLREAEWETLNPQLLAQLNQTGQVYLSHTRLAGRYTLRAVFGQPTNTEAQVANLLRLLDEQVARLPMQ